MRFQTELLDCNILNVHNYSLSQINNKHVT